MTNINNPDYDLKEFENIIENYKKDEFAYLNQYYTKYYLLGTNEKITEDFYIYQAPNKLCVIGLAPTHPLLQPQPQQQNQLPKIKKIEYNAKAVDTINKKKQNLLSITSNICTITTIITEQEEKRYQIKAGVIGWLVDINMRFNNNSNNNNNNNNNNDNNNNNNNNEFDLLQNKPFTEGYIAIIKPKHDNPSIALGHCISEEQYNEYIIKLSGENTTLK
ncbi:hypothetical protein Glove_423g22 [Diversispora epigaea]|uniref:Actin-binding transcription modulator n=1 Tax=Diversispora epigaea TaxID=1348612 RepID=A0A397GVV6_9GLOM|nr:hypothetical protein Glove_423g22 [Diversispora epigaea]